MEYQATFETRGPRQQRSPQIALRPPIECYPSIRDLAAFVRTSEQIYDKLNDAILLWAAHENRPKSAERFLRSGPSGYPSDLYGYMALQVAASHGGHGAEDVVRMLLGFSINPNPRAEWWQVDHSKPTPIENAISSRNLAIVKMLLETGADLPNLHASHVAGRFICLCADESNFNMVEFVMEHAFPANTVDQYGSTLLHDVARRGHVPMLRLLLKNNMEINRQDSNGKTALHYAVKAGRLEASEILLQAGALPNVPDRLGQTPLHLAVDKRNPRMMQLLIANGADVDAKDSRGQTPMHRAVKHASCAGLIAKILLDEGAAPSVVDKDHRTPLHLAFKYGREEAIQLLLNAGVLDCQLEYTPGLLLYAAKMGYASVVERLLEEGVDPDVETDEAGNTALMFATKAGREGLLGLLLSKSNAPDRRNNSGQTPLLSAAWGGSVESMQILLDRKNSLDSPGRHGLTALMHATRNPHAEVFGLVLDRSSDVDRLDHNHQTALHHAAQNGHVQAVDLLLNVTSAVNWADKKGNTPLLLGVIYKNYDIVQRLLTTGAKVGFRNQLGRTALDYALAQRNEDMLALLLQSLAQEKATQGNSD
jgi:ankyrin repeat protein